MHKKDGDDFGLPKNKPLPLVKFKHDIVETLHKGGKVVGSSKRGRSFTSLEKRYEAKKAKGYNSKAIPQQDIRKDNIDHFPVYKRALCKLPG